MVTITVPTATLLPTLIVNVEEPEPPLTLDGLNVPVRPAVENDAESPTLSVKPYFGVTVIVAVPLSPEFIERDVGLAVRSKSGLPGAVTVTRTMVECIKEPLVPVTVTM